VQQNDRSDCLHFDTPHLTSSAFASGVHCRGGMYRSNDASAGDLPGHITPHEVALKQLTGLHPLPPLILEYRCMHNIFTKWIQPPWVHQIAAATAGLPCIYAEDSLLVFATPTESILSTALVVFYACQCLSADSCTSAVLVISIVCTNECCI
jgi:hypothetical protein